MNRYHIVHRTTYSYSKAVSLSHNEGHLLPRDGAEQRCDEGTVRIYPEPSIRFERNDYFGNRVFYFALEAPHHEIEVIAESRVTRMADPPTFADNGAGSGAGHASSSWEELRDQVGDILTHGAAQSEDRLPSDLVDYVFDSPMIPARQIDSRAVADFARSVFTPGRSFYEACVELNARIHGEFRYDSEFSRVGTPLEEVLQHRRGVCQDFAHLYIACLRALGLPARYVSGYLETRPPPGRPRLQGADASHAWVSVYMPAAASWIDFDPTNNLIVGNHHIVLGHGRDYSDVTPLKGVIFGGGKHSVQVAVDVVPQ
jgi:transglutaminase-like putative cysteine protease